MIRPKGRAALITSTCAFLTLAVCSVAHTPTTRSISAAGSAASTTTAPTPTTTTVPAEPGWTPISVGPSGVVIDERDVTTLDGRHITVVRFRAGQVQYNLHIGSQDPPSGAAVLGPESSLSVSSAELTDLLAAFNGGFKANASAGGVDVGGQVLTPLVDGFASFVIDTDGTGRIGVWGSTVPVPGEQISSVRQNLPPLIENGQISPAIGDVTQWGDALHGVAATARSALGEDAQGDILYAGAMSALPVDLATALSDDGATVAMELDINPEWIQLDVASGAGGPLQAVVPGQSRPADQYLVGWTRDFITVLAPPVGLVAGTASGSRS
ncbi:MAG: hypothetical protein ACLQRH_24990 [Acidimicrobiales bacterium]